MKEMIPKLFKNRFVRNVTVLATGTAAAQAVTLMSSPIITRLYGPEVFGMMGVFMTIVQIFIPIAALTYPFAIVLPRDDRNAESLIKLSIYISLVLTLFITVVLLLFIKPIVALFQLQEVSSYLFFVPLVILLAGLMEVCNQWLIRTKQFGVNAKVSFLQSLLTNGGKIGVGFFYPLASVLIIFNTLANGVRAGLMFLFIRKSSYKSSKENEEPRFTLKEMAIKYRDFPLYKAPQTLMNALSQGFPILMLTAFFGPTAAGFYTLGNNVLQQPINLIGNSVGNVFFPRIAEAAKNRESLSKLISKATIALAFIGFIPFSVIILFGPCIFSLIFGADWGMAGKYAQWIGLFLFCEFINKPSLKTLPVLSAQLFHLIFTIITLVVRVVSLAIGYYVFNSDLVAIALFSVSSALMHIILILLVLIISRRFYEKSLIV